MSDRIIKLRLSESQAAQLAPLTIQAGLQRENILFIASCVPHWSVDEGETIWELQVVKISAPLGYKLVRMIREAMK